MLEVNSLMSCIKREYHKLGLTAQVTMLFLVSCYQELDVTHVFTCSIPFTTHKTTYKNDK